MTVSLNKQEVFAMWDSNSVKASEGKSVCEGKILVEFPWLVEYVKTRMPIKLMFGNGYKTIGPKISEIYRKAYVEMVLACRMKASIGYRVFTFLHKLTKRKPSLFDGCWAAMLESRWMTESSVD